MAEIGAVYDARRRRAPWPTSSPPQHRRTRARPGPVATNKWSCASVVTTPAAVIAHTFDEAERATQHRRAWFALVDGANHQIERIN